MMVWVALAVLGVVVAAAIHRPTLFLLGWRYLRSNPKQGAVAVAGLMVGMAVLVGTGITTESAAHELERQLAQQRGVTDAVLRFQPTSVGEAAAWFAADAVADDVVAVGLAYRARNVAIDPVGGVGVSGVPVIGIDREAYRAAVDWQELVAAPQPDGLVLTRSLADTLGVSAGDQVTLYLPPAIESEVRYEPTVDVRTFNGTWVAAASGPEGPVHSDEDVYEFGLDVPEYALQLDLQLGTIDSLPGNMSIVATDPSGRTYTDWGNGNAYLTVRAAPFSYLPAGRWTLAAHSDAAVGRDFEMWTQLEWLTLRPDSPPGAPRLEASTWYTEQGRFIGRVLAAAQGPDGPVHSEEDRHAFSLEVPAETHMVRLTLQPASARTGWTLVATTPSGTVYTGRMEGLPAPTNSPDIIVQAPDDGFVEAGAWDIEVHADAAVNEGFRIDYTLAYMAYNPDYVITIPKPVAVTHAVAAVVHDSADPGGAGAAVFAPMTLAHAIDGTEGVVDEAVVRLEDDADVAAVLERLQRTAAGANVVGQDLRSGPREEADRLRDQMGETWGFMGGFTIAASLLLVFVLMALLVDERRPVLATMRAVGAQREDLTRMQTFEALGYGLGAALVGALAGLGLSWVLRRQARDVWGGGQMVIDPGAILSSLLLGLLLLLSFAAIAAHRAAGLDVASALRGEDAPRPGNAWGRLVGGCVLSLAAALALLRMAGGDPAMVTLGPSLAIIAAGLFLSLRMSRYIVFPIVGSALLLWLVITYGVLADIDSATEALLLPARALAFCTAAALLLIYSRPIHAGISWLAGYLPGGFAFEAAMRQVRGRAGRATLTVLMLGMVILSVSFMQAVVAAEDAQRWHDLGDYDVVATTDAPMGDVDAWLAANPPVNGADPMANVASWADTTWSQQMPNLQSSSGTVQVREGYGVTPALVESARIPVLDGPDAGTAFQQVLDNPSLIIVTADVVNAAHETPAVGSVLRHDVPGEEMDLEVVAVLDARWMGSAFVHPSTLEMLLNADEDPRMVPGRAILAVAEPGASPEQVGKEIAAGFRDVGMVWQLAGDARDDRAAESAAFSGMLAVFVMLALAVGAVSLGLISARNVISRRREIGMVRSVGAQRGVVVGMVLAETLYLVAIAVVIGFIGSAMTLAGLDEEALRFDMVAAAGLALYALALGAVAAALPAWGAARLDPAAAVRHVE